MISRNKSNRIGFSFRCGVPKHRGCPHKDHTGSGLADEGSPYLMTAARRACDESKTQARRDIPCGTMGNTRAGGNMAETKKQVPLRLSPILYEDLSVWAENDFRSINGQIEYLLTACVREHKKSGRATPADLEKE